MERLDYIINNCELSELQLHINSNQRNSQQYVNSNSFTIHLSEPIKHVVSLKVIDSFVPDVEYMIDVHNNLLRLDNNDYHITPGNYDINSLVQELNSVLNNIVISVVNDKLQFNSPNPFTIKYTNLNYILGLPNVEIISSQMITNTQHTIIATNIPNLFKYPYVYLRSDEYFETANKLNSTYLEKLVLSPSHQTYYHNQTFINRIPRTIPSISFRLEHEDGTLYDFKGTNICFTLLVKYYKEPIMRSNSPVSVSYYSDSD